MGHPISKVHVTSEFERAFRNLPENIQCLAEKKDKWFRQNDEISKDFLSFSKEKVQWLILKMRP